MENSNPKFHYQNGQIIQVDFCVNLSDMIYVYLRDGNIGLIKSSSIEIHFKNGFPIEMSMFIIFYNMHSLLRKYIRISNFRFELVIESQ